MDAGRLTTSAWRTPVSPTSAFASLRTHLHWVNVRFPSPSRFSLRPLFPPETCRQLAALHLRLPIQPHVSQINYNIGVGLRRRHCHQQRRRIPSIASPTLHALHQRRHSCSLHVFQLNSQQRQRALTTQREAWLRLSTCVSEMYNATYVSLKLHSAFIFNSTPAACNAAESALEELLEGFQGEGAG